MSCSTCQKQSVEAFNRLGVSPQTTELVFARNDDGGNQNTCPGCGNFSVNGETCRSCQVSSSLKQRENGAASSLTEVKGNLHRCRSCGRFAGLNKSHICPVASSPEALSKALGRRIGGDASKLYGMERVQQLFSEAAQSESKTVKMIHPFNQATCDAELDALPILMQAGFLPESWESETAYRVLGKDGRVYEVCDLDDKLSFAPIANDPIQEAAQAYGLYLNGNAPSVISADPAMSSAPFYPQYSVQNHVPVLGGANWDTRTFNAREFATSRNKEVYPGFPHKVGDRVRGQQSPRRSQNTATITVGRTMPQAVCLKASGELHPHVLPNGAAEVYDRRGELVAAYDPTNRAVGKTAPAPGEQPDMTAAQVLAYAYAVGDPALRREIDGVTITNALQVADSMYLVIKNDMETNGGVIVGGHADAQRCASCGQFTGTQPHICPNASFDNDPPSTPPVEEPPTPPPPITTAVPAQPTETKTGQNAQAQTPNIKTKAKDVRPNSRLPTPDNHLAPVDFIFKDVLTTAPDPWLSDVPADMGGNLDEPLSENIPAHDPSFVLDKQSERILATISASLQLAQDMPPQHAPKMRAFGLYGPPGTGKNMLGKELAASIRTLEADGSIRQGIHHHTQVVTPEMQAADIIGAATLEATPEGGTRTKVTLGPVGLAAATGAVISIDEIVRNPKLATKLQPMIEDGVIEIDSPEVGVVKIPVHPATVFVFTWNPGNEGDADRPAQAPLSRMATFRMEVPKDDQEIAYRLANFMDKMGLSVEKLAMQDASLQSSYKLPATTDMLVSRTEMDKAIGFWRDVQHMTTPTKEGLAEVGAMSSTATTPGQRELQRFMLLGKTVGWDQAAKIFQVCCDQNEDFQSQWNLVQERFNHYFGYGY